LGNWAPNVLRQEETDRQGDKAREIERDIRGENSCKMVFMLILYKLL